MLFHVKQHAINIIIIWSFPINPDVIYFRTKVSGYTLATIKIGLAPYMALSWNEIKTRANAFSKEWHDAANEDSQAKPFLIGFLKYSASPISA